MSADDADRAEVRSWRKGGIAFGPTRDQRHLHYLRLSAPSADEHSEMCAQCFLYIGPPPGTMPWYKQWFGTRYYKLLYGHRDEDDARAWAEMIVLRAALVPGNALLDIGCGRGRHAGWFAQNGLRVTGIDISEESIHEARAVAPGAEFHVHDMREPFVRGAFDAVVCLFTSLGYSASRADDQRAIDAAATALKAGGIFVLDLMNGAIVRKELVEQECLAEEGVRFTIKRCMEGNDIVKRISVDDEGCAHSFMERVHAWTADEVTAMVLIAGLRLEAITDGPDPLPFDPTRSERIVVWARKPA